MAVSDQTRSGDLAETFKSERETTKNQIRVALPGIVQSFDPDAVTAVVQPSIRSVETDNDGNRVTQNYPLLVDVPVVFPRGGGCTLTFPVKAGDECLVIFADRCIDFWWQSGGIRKRILETRGVKSILSFNTTVDTTTRRVMFSAEIDTLYGITTVTSEA